MDHEHFLSLIHYLRLHGNIPEADLPVLFEHLSFRQAPTGEILLRAGSIAREMFFITEGILKIATINEKGNHVTQFFLKENYFCTILRSFNFSEPADESIIAACDVSLVVISKSNMQSLYSKLSYFKGLITGITQQTLMEKIRVRNAYMGEDATTRYKKFLSRQADIVMRVPLSDVASYLGITQQSLSRIRRSISADPGATVP